MLAGTHIVVGAGIYQLVERKPRWMRWVAVIAGGFFSHYVLDSMTTYHSVYGSRLWPWDNNWWPWHNVAYIDVQIVAVFAIWFIGALEARGWKRLLPPMFLSGLWAWLCWDGERIFGVTWLHVQSIQTWAPRALSGFSRNPWTGLWEVGLVVALIVIIFMARRRAESLSAVPAPRAVVSAAQALPVVAPPARALGAAAAQPPDAPPLTSRARASQAQLSGNPAARPPARARS